MSEWKVRRCYVDALWTMQHARTCLSGTLTLGATGWIQGERARFECGDNVFDDSGQKGIDRELEKAGAQLNGSPDPDLAATGWNRCARPRQLKTSEGRVRGCHDDVLGAL
jgi:hypothetical protein